MKKLIMMIPALLFVLGTSSCMSTDEPKTTQAQSLDLAPPQFRTPSRSELRRVKKAQEKKQQSADNMSKDGTPN